MCLNPVKIRNPTKRISRAGGNQMFLEVPCNKCAECVTAIRSQWYFRTYQEVQYTLKHGGYIYFDTLTYSDEYLPRLSHYVNIEKYPVRDFSCFSHSHFKLFLKNLRRQLSYYYGDNSFRYFLTSEYGVDERFTNRPHYHIMFFVTSKVNPLDFSRFVAKCWHYGRTDGIPYKSIKYVSGHVYGRDLGFGSNVDFNAISSVCMYVSKYITKSSKFQNRLDKRIYMLSMYITDEEELKTLKRNMNMFHRQSQGFGLGYLYAMDKEQISLVLNNQCSMPDKDKIHRLQPLPMYYKRHLFYKLHKRDDGTYYWELTQSGRHYRIQHMLKNVDNLVKQYENDIINMDDFKKSLLYTYLDDRTLQDYALYNVFYKNRMRLYDSSELGDIEYNLLDWIEILKQSFQSNSLSRKIVYEIDNDNIHLNPFDDDFYSSTSFVKENIFTSQSCYEFRNYDKIEAIFKEHNKVKNKVKQQTFNHIEDMKERLKSIIK